MAPRLEFDRARFVADATPAQGSCGWCGRSLMPEHSQILGRPACQICTRQVESQLPPDTWPVFWRAVGAASLAACAGSLLGLVLLSWLPLFRVRIWAAFVCALLLGWVVARVLRMASGGLGGRRYQFAAALLLYAAILSAVGTSLFGAAHRAGWHALATLLEPFALLVAGYPRMAAWELLMAFLGIRIAWNALRASPAVILRAQPKGSGGEPKQ